MMSRSLQTPGTESRIVGAAKLLVMIPLDPIGCRIGDSEYHSPEFSQQVDRHCKTTLYQQNKPLSLEVTYARGL